MITRIPFFPLGWAALALLCAAPASAAVVSDDFNDGLQTPGLWAFVGTANGPVVDEKEGRLEVTVPATSSGAAFFAAAETRPHFRGDLDVQVDFQMLEYPARNGVRMGIVIHRSGQAFASVQRTSLSEQEPLGEPRESYLLDTGTALGRHGTDATTGKLRLTRVGSTLTGYYWDAETAAWVPFASGTTTEVDVRFGLSAWSHDNAFQDQDVRVAFDNFIVNQGQLVGDALPDLEGQWLQVQQRSQRTGAGRRVTVQGIFAVRNAGEVAARASVVRFYLSEDETLSPDDLPLQPRTVGRLLPGRLRLAVFGKTLPNGVAARRQFVLAVIDAENAASETNEFGHVVAHGPLQ